MLEVLELYENSFRLKFICSAISSLKCKEKFENLKCKKYHKILQKLLTTNLEKYFFIAKSRKVIRCFPRSLKTAYLSQICVVGLVLLLSAFR